MSSTYAIVNRYNALINRVQKNNNMDDSALGDLKWSIRGDDFRGWLKCDGRLVLRANYPHLYDLIGHSFANVADPDGEHSLHFRLPDARNRVLGMVGPAREATLLNGDVVNLSERTLGNVTGNETHTLTIAQMPTHTHTGNSNVGGVHSHSITDPGHNHGIERGDAGATGGEFGENLNTSSTAYSNDNYTGITINTDGSHKHTLINDNTGGSQPHNNMQPTLFIGNVFIYAGNYFDTATNDDDPENNDVPE